MSETKVQDPSKHKWKVYLSAVPGDPVERDIACDKCGDVLTDENEDDACFWEEL